MIEFRNVSKSYFRTPEEHFSALDGVSLHVKEGQVFGVIGQSGAGKSTLVRCVNGLETPDSGEVHVNGQLVNTMSEKALRSLRQQVGCVFQDFNLLSSYTVEDNIGLPLRLVGTPKTKIRQRVDELLDLTAITDKRHAYPAQLSGGQKQRVGIARALVTKPPLLLCDEPTSSLDPLTTNRILRLISDLHADLKVTVLLVSHEMAVIRDLCDEVALFENGKIVEQATAASFFDAPTTEEAQSFLEKVS